MNLRRLLAHASLGSFMMLVPALSAAQTADSVAAPASPPPAAASPPAPAATLIRVTGRVLDRAGKPIEYATVAAPALKRGAATDDQGRFTLTLPAGRVTLQVSQLGYETSRVEVSVAEGLGPLRLVLSDQPVPLSEVTVAASSFGKTGKSEGAVVNRRDVVMTPGGAADIFQALRALPGINAPDEGAAVVVRGGPPDETLIRIDGTDIGHPYHYENASGGLFSNLDSFMLKSAFFSSGGFGSKYGGVLSGVLDIETQDPMNQKVVSVGLGMAGFGVSTSTALIPDRLALVGTARMSLTSILFRLYGSSSEYESAPSSADGMAKLIGKYSQTGRVSIMFLDAGDQVSVFSNRLNYHGLYHETARSQFAALTLQDVIAGKVAVRGELGGQAWASRWTYGPARSSEAERNGQASLEAVWPVTSRHELSFGFSERARHSEITGSFPDDSTDFAPGAPVRTRETRPSVSRPGFYLEDKMRLWGPFYATLGGRVDYASTPGAWTTDPRGALAWRVDDHQTLRVAVGRYHQLVGAAYLDPRFGNPELEPLEADHAIAGYEWKSNAVNVRLEGYSKTYRNLVLNDSLTFFSSRGHGYARGVDAFVQGTWNRTTGWLSYGYLDTRRRELDDPRELPARFDVRHTVTAVVEYAVSNVWHTGARYSFNSGHPWTPVVDRTWDPGRGIWRPVFGENSSAWFPPYHRLDLRLTRLFTLPGAFGVKPSNVCAFYVEGMNVLGIKNLLEYNYSADYSQRIERDSYFSRRLLVAGVGMTW